MRISDWSSDVCSSDLDPDLSAAAVIERVRPKLAAISRGTAVPLNVPPIVGLGSTGGFEYALQALQGQPAADIAATVRGMSLAANQDPALAGVFSTFAANTPQLYLDIDREKAQTPSVAVDDIFTALPEIGSASCRERVGQYV